MKKLSNTQAIIFLLLEGFASVAIQFLVIRNLTPLVGSSVVITSLVISIFLGALALGYRKGGRVNKDHAKQLSSNLIKASVFLGIFTSYLFIDATFLVFSHLLISPIITVLIFLLFVMAPMVFWLGQTIPLLVNFIEADTSSRQTGDALLFSTVGNVVGGIVSTLVIMYFFGIAWAIYINVVILAFLSFYVSNRKVEDVSKVLLVLISSYFINIAFEQSWFSQTTAYANYHVVDSETKLEFVSNNSGSSMISKEKQEGHPYIENIKKFISAFDKNNPENSILVIGSGGFSLTANDDIKAKVHYVDIDSQIKEIAETHFLKSPVRGEFTGVDARAFLRDVNNKDQYDIVIVDAYTNRSSIPWSLATKEFYSQVTGILKDDGLMLSNVISDPFMADSFSRRIDNTIHSVFSESSCFKNVISFSRTTSNVVYTCSKTIQKNKSDLVYSDVNNRSTVDFFVDRAGQ